MFYAKALYTGTANVINTPIRLLYNTKVNQSSHAKSSRVMNKILK